GRLGREAEDGVLGDRARHGRRSQVGGPLQKANGGLRDTFRMLLDVSQPVAPSTAVFPGDEPFSCGWTGRLAEGFSVNLAWTRGSTHVGTHVDAPYHTLEGAGRVGALPLDAFVGPCVVIDAVGRSALDASLLRGVDLEAS